MMGNQEFEEFGKDLGKALEFAALALTGNMTRLYNLLARKALDGEECPVDNCFSVLAQIRMLLDGRPDLDALDNYEPLY